MKINVFRINWLPITSSFNDYNRCSMACDRTSITLSKVDRYKRDYRLLRGCCFINWANVRYNNNCTDCSFISHEYSSVTQGCDIRQDNQCNIVMVQTLGKSLSLWKLLLWMFVSFINDRTDKIEHTPVKQIKWLIMPYVLHGPYVLMHYCEHIIFQGCGLTKIFLLPSISIKDIKG